VERSVSALFRGTHAGLRDRIIAIFALLILFNAAAWLWALAVFRGSPLMSGAAVLAYGLGLRHAFDADHIAAIDNVTRKLMWEGQRPVSVGLFFSLGHSTVVAGFSCAVALAIGAFDARLDLFRSFGGVVGASASIIFLSAIAVANLVALVSIFRKLQIVKAGRASAHEDLDALSSPKGLVGRACSRCFAMIGRSWQMYPLGVLFALGFDSATEVGLLGLSTTQYFQDLPIWSMLAFPLLFAAAMTLADTADGVLMLGAYGWAFATPIRKLYYNLTITAASVVAAAFVVALQALSLIGRGFRLPTVGGFWGAIDALNEDFGVLGCVIVGVLASCWLIFYLLFRRESRPQRAAPSFAGPLLRDIPTGREL